MGFEFTFEVDGEDQVRRSFSRFADAIKDFSPAFKEIAEDFKEIEKRQFDTEGVYGSGGWRHLSPNYATWKHKYHPGKKILELSGLLKESLESENPYTIKEIQPQQMKLGTKINYAIYHQRGTLRMPARPVIKLTEADKDRWTKILHQYMVSESNKAFSGLMPGITAGQKHVGSI